RAPTLADLFAPFPHCLRRSRVAGIVRAAMQYPRALRASLLALLLSPLALAACGETGDDEGGGTDTAGNECAAAPAPKFSEMTAVWAKCTTCHASSLEGAARSAAPVGVDFDTHAAAKAKADAALTRVEAGTMPPQG